ncbi:MAG TPA: DPP IV N-terminal domain-containing protein [Xanthomonadaceae bacterium]|nr:DPP IV N-terminal domain-containing protein [Xanthomonadaceae bacterium]
MADLRPRLLGAALLCTVLPVFAAAPMPALTADDYARAERFVGYHANPLVDHAVNAVTWLDAGSFWYRDHDAHGDRFLRYELATGTVSPLVDAQALADALAKTAGKPVDATRLKITEARIAADGGYEVVVGKDRYLCGASGKPGCVLAPKPGHVGEEPGVRSPDGRSEAFIRDWNLWLRDLASGAETQLTTDGATDYGYATDNAGWTHSDRAILVWSPDSRRIATFRQDQRRTGSMTLVGTGVGRPKVETWKYPLVGDQDLTMIERVVIDVRTRSVLHLRTPPDQHRSTLCDDVSCDGGWEDVQWADDGRSLAFASVSRDHKDVWIRIADTASGAVRTVLHEHVPTYYESGNGAVNWRYLPQSHELLWFSERNDWGNLYLYGLDGTLKHAVTTGEGNVTEVLRVDPKTRTLWFRGVGRTRGVDPYYQQFFKASLDGGAPVLLAPEAADHAISLSPDGAHFVDAYSTPATPPVTVLRDANDGRVVAEIARADVTRLRAIGWVPPEAFTVKARDGSTDLYGLLFKPTRFDPAKKYPVIDYIYPGPQTGSVGGRGFDAARRDHQALAELGFVVVAIDGLGTPWRSKTFHDAFDGDIGDNTLPDQVAGLKQLAARHPWIDLDRVGVWGHSGGGYATADAMFSYPDFFKVGISESGNHDNRNYEDDWAEKWQGLETVDADGRSSYAAQANAGKAANLKGRLMLAHGLMDDNVPPQNTFLVVDALVKANKDFDLVVFPQARHGYGKDAAYMMRRRWDYFVRWLLGATPPREYAMHPPAGE